jgi:hypothetical protein
MTPNRLISAIQTMTSSRDPGTRAWAREQLRTMAMPGVSVLEHLQPMLTAPVDQLTHHERTARRIASTAP